MNVVKKIISMTLAALLLMAVLAGCGGSAGKEVTLAFWTHIDDEWNNEHDKIIADFEAANPGIKVSRESFPDDSFEAEAQADLANKPGGADIYQIGGGWGVDLVRQGVFAPVPDDLIAEIKDDSYGAALGALEYDESYYGIPLELCLEYGGMLVSIPMFNERGVSYPATWDEMIGIAKANSRSDGENFEMTGLDFSADSLTYIWLSMILSSGGQYIENDKFNFETPIGIETMQRLVDYIKTDRIMSASGIINADIEEAYQRLYREGTTLMMPCGPGVIPEGSAEYGVTYGVDYEYVAMPFYGLQELFVAEAGWGLAVNADSSNQKEAWKFIEFWCEKERMLKFNIATGMVPAYKSIAQDPAILRQMPYLEPLIDILDGGRFIGCSNTDALKNDVRDMFVDIINNDTPVAEAVKELDSRLNSEIE